MLKPGTLVRICKRFGELREGDQARIGKVNNVDETGRVTYLVVAVDPPLRTVLCYDHRFTIIGLPVYNYDPSRISRELKL